MAHGDDSDHEHDENCDHEHDGEELDPSSPRGQLNELLNGAVEIAAELLAEHGEFDPFALALRQDGEIMHLGSDGGDVPADGESPIPTPSWRASVPRSRSGRPSSWRPPSSPT